MICCICQTEKELFNANRLLRKEMVRKELFNIKEMVKKRIV